MTIGVARSDAEAVQQALVVDGGAAEQELGGLGPAEVQAARITRGAFNELFRVPVQP